MIVIFHQRKRHERLLKDGCPNAFVLGQRHVPMPFVAILQQVGKFAKKNVLRDRLSEKLIFQNKKNCCEHILVTNGQLRSRKMANPIKT